MKQLMVRMMNLVLIVGALCIYQNHANVRADEVAAYEAQVAEANQLQAEYDAMLAQAEDSGLQDGVYAGTGSGFGGDIVIEVTVSNHQIVKIEILSAEGEDSAYLSQAKSLIDEILLSQNVDVDTVSGATFSSRGILDAVANALEEQQ